MGDLINREDAINLLKKWADGYSYIEIETESAIKAFEKLLPAETEFSWIPCSERLPEEDVNVLVSVHFLGLEIKYKTGWKDNIKESWYVDIASQIDGVWHSASDEYKVARNRHEVTAWIPLPKPYKMDEVSECITN